MRARLSEQLNSILQTRDSARGLIVSMSDVLFDTGKFSLKPGAREKLAKVAGILLAYPGLNIEVGGYTDNVGGDAMNQTLSENRAGLRARLSGAGRRSDEFGQRQRLRQHFAGSLKRQLRRPAAEPESGTSRIRRRHRHPGERDHRKLAVGRAQAITNRNQWRQHL